LLVIVFSVKKNFCSISYLHFNIQYACRGMSVSTFSCFFSWCIWYVRRPWPYFRMLESGLEFWTYMPSNYIIQWALPTLFFAHFSILYSRFINQRL